MERETLDIGSVITLDDGIQLKVAKEVAGCDFCYFENSKLYNCTATRIRDVRGHCSRNQRTDTQGVIYVEI